MKLQNPDKKTLREAAFSQESSLVAELSMEEEDEGLPRGGDRVKKIEVSGGNISLVVDFSGSLTGISSDNFIETDGSCPIENPVKEYGHREDQTKEVLVGNLVWAMTKSKKWWPGEVVDFKADAKESFMVRYIGQSQLLSWCAPSELKPFKESFDKVVYQRNDRGFFLALEKAMALLGNTLKLDMACSCVAERNGISAQHGKTRKTKPLILREFSVDRLEPKEFVSQLKNLAEWDSNDGILEMTVMKSRLSAFYSFFGHKQIPMDQLHRNESRKCFTAAKMKDSEFIGSPSVVAGSSRSRFRKQWFRKFVSEVDNVSARDDLLNTSPSYLISKLKLLAVDYKCSEETENMGLFEWFFSKFRISMFHDEIAYKMQLTNMAGLKDLMLAKDANPGTEQKTSKSKKSGKSKIETINGVPTPDNEKKASKSMKSQKKKVKHIIGHSDFTNSFAIEPCAKDFQEISLVQSSEGKVSMENTLRTPPTTLLPDLNSGGNASGIAEFDHLQRPETSILPNICPREVETPRSMMLNFNVPAPPCSTYGVSGTQFVSSPPASGIINFTNTDLYTSVISSGKKKRARKRKNAEELPIAAQTTTGIPDLNGITPEAASVLSQVEPTQPRRRRKKDESPNGLTRAITILFLKFTSQVSMPSRDDLTSTFSAFGPLDASATHISEESSVAEVAFVSSGDAIEAVKSLEKANPFGETLVSYRLQQKLITVQRNIAPPLPVIAHVSPILKPNNTPSSVDAMKQNLMMMTAMLEKSGDSLSRETKAKLKSEITCLLEKVSSMPSSSSS